jgi:type IV pilus assembly protein PilN
VGWRCGGSCSDPHQPAPASGGKTCRAKARLLRRSGGGVLRLGSEIKKLEAEIKDIANLRAEIDALKARQKAVEDLQADRNVPVHLLNELVKQTPEGVYLTNIKQAGQTVTVTGVAQTNERVSEFLRNALYNSTWLERPELIEIKAVAATAQQGRTSTASRLFDFSMRVSIKRPQAPADAASAPAGKAPGAVAKAS